MGQKRTMSGSSMGPRVTGKQDRYEGCCGPEHTSDKAFAATEAETWKKFAFVAAPIACLIGAYL